MRYRKLCEGWNQQRPGGDGSAQCSASPTGLVSTLGRSARSHKAQGTAVSIDIVPAPHCGAISFPASDKASAAELGCLLGHLIVPSAEQPDRKARTGDPVRARPEGRPGPWHKLHSEAHTILTIASKDSRELIATRNSERQSGQGAYLEQPHRSAGLPRTS